MLENVHLGRMRNGARAVCRMLASVPAGTVVSDEMLIQVLAECGVVAKDPQSNVRVIIARLRKKLDPQQYRVERVSQLGYKLKKDKEERC